MATSREIIVTQALNGHFTAEYNDYADLWSSPSGHGWTREKALGNLAIDEAYIAKHGTTKDQYPEDFQGEDGN